jgi:hypothetical protein
MMRLQWLFAILVTSAAGVLAACGSVVSGGGGSGDPPEEGSWASYCDARAAACGISADLCKAREGCAKGILRDEIEEGLFGCLASTCDEDVCFQKVAAENPPTAMGEEFKAAWQSYIGACPTGNDDVEMATWLVADDRLGDYKACATTSGCEAAGACFSQLDAAHVDVCEGWF